MPTPLIPEYRAAELLGVDRHTLANIARQLSELGSPAELRPPALRPGSARPSRRYPADRAELRQWIQLATTWISDHKRAA